MTVPDLKVQMAFSVGPYDELSDLNWSNVTTLVKEASCYRGRPSELDQFPAGTATIVLDNSSRDFDPLNSAGPLYGNLVANVPVRLLADVDGEDDPVPIWRGFVDGWPATYSDGGTRSEVEVACTDAWKLLAERPLPDTLRDDVEGISVPESWYRLAGTSGGFVTDRYGVRSGIVATTLSTHDPLSATSAGSLLIPSFQPATGAKLGGFSFPVGNATDTPLRGTFWSLGFWCQFADRGALGAQGHRMLTLELGPDTGSGDFVAVQIALAASTGLPSLVVDGVGATLSAFVVPAELEAEGFTIDLCDGRPHHVVAVRFHTTIELYVDSVRVAAAFNAAATGWWDMTGASLWIGRTPYGNGAAVHPAWAISDLMFWPGDTLLTSEIEDLYAAFTVGWQPPAPSGTVIGEVLDLVGWPASLRAIDPGEIVVTPPATPEGTSTLDLIQTIAATEQGRLFVDAAGRITFHDRGRFLREPAEAAVQYTFSDDEGPPRPDVGVLDGTLRVTLDDRLVYDAAKVTRAGGDPQTAALSATPARTLTIDGLLFSDDVQALNTAEWITFRFGAPQPRSEEWQVNPAVLPDDWADILALEIGHRVEHDVTPGGVGSSLQLEQHVEVIGHDITPEGDWVVTLNGVPVDPNNYLLWAAFDLPSTDDDHGWAGTGVTGGAWG